MTERYCTFPLIRRPSHSLRATCLAAARSRHGSDCPRQESVEIFGYIKGFFDKITTPQKVVKAVTGPEERQREHTKNVVNTIYNLENNKQAPVSENFESYEFFELRTGKKS